MRLHKLVAVAASVGAVALGPLSPAVPGAQASTCTGGADALVGHLPFGWTTCNGVRPGATVNGCTLNFLFAGGDGHRYMGTAGHCIVGVGTTDHVFASPGPAAVVDGMRIGEFAYAQNGDSRDIALIRLDPGVDASPELAHFGGPVGIYTDHSPSPVVLHHYSRASDVGKVVYARTAIARNTTGYAKVPGLAAVSGGDSGSPVIDASGRAVGILVTLPGGITRLDYQLPFAEAALGTTLTLQTAPFRALVTG